MAAKAFKEETHDYLVLKGSGLAISKTLRLADLLRHGIEGLHTIVRFHCEEVQFESERKTDETRTRNIPTIEIMLSKDLELVSTEDIGYQPPVDSSLLKDLTV